MTAVEALIGCIGVCRDELLAIEKELDLVHDHHDPDKVNWALAGSFGHLAELLTEARQFIKGEED